MLLRTKIFDKKNPLNREATPIKVNCKNSFGNGNTIACIQYQYISIYMNCKKDKLYHNTKMATWFSSCQCILLVCKVLYFQVEKIQVGIANLFKILFWFAIERLVLLQVFFSRQILLISPMIENDLSDLIYSFSVMWISAVKLRLSWKNLGPTTRLKGLSSHHW